MYRRATRCCLLVNVGNRGQSYRRNTREKRIEPLGALVVRGKHTKRINEMCRCARRDRRWRTCRCVTLALVFALNDDCLYTPARSYEKRFLPVD
jgi:hypothetical protein